MTSILWFHDIGMSDLAQVGGKNASLGEMVSHLSTAGVRVPKGFATTADAYREFLSRGGLDARIRAMLDGLHVEDVVELARCGAEIREWIADQPLPVNLEDAVRSAFATLLSEESDPSGVTWAVRSSATAEDLPSASFAGQQETFLHIGGIDEVLAAIKLVFASLYNDRAIAYRVHNGFAGTDIALSAGIQRMVRTDVGASGVMFTVDTESGFNQAVLVTSAYGLGEAIVQGAVNPDEFFVYKPALRAGRPAIVKRQLGAKTVAMRYTATTGAGASIALHDVDPGERRRFSITDAEVEELARQGLIIEAHYGRPMDIEWGRDGVDGTLYILQARPETVVSQEDASVIRRFVLNERSAVLATGRAIGQKIGTGRVRQLSDPRQMRQFHAGEVLVADMTDPDWEPIMKKASAIITNRGGRTCHAAIIARELGIPAVVGTMDATRSLEDGTAVTVVCSDGDQGLVYAGALGFSHTETMIDGMPEVPVEIMMNVGMPEQAFSLSQLPNDGVGLARLEFIIEEKIGIHPRAVLEYDTLSVPLRAAVEERTAAYASPRHFFVSRLTEGVAMIAAAFSPKPVIVRLSDFKSNEYSTLLGGADYEPHEDNPMIGWRGASRYATADFRPSFELECEALAFVRNEMGLTNLKLMVPFVRTVAEGRAVVDLLAANGLERGVNGLEVMMMCEIPSNALLADEFLDLFDGFSIGSNDMTQLVLGVDRDSELLAASFDERDPAVRKIFSLAIRACNRRGKYVGICGQGPSDHPDLARWLVDQGIGSISLNPDTVVATWVSLAASALPPTQPVPVC